MEEVVKRHILESFGEKFDRAGKLAKGELLTISASTMKRYFKRARELGGQGLSTTRPSSILRTEIPICTASFWDATVPGTMAADTVAHCGTSTEGQDINSLWASVDSSVLLALSNGKATG